MDKYNVTLYAAVNRYKLREAQNLFFNDYSDVQQLIDRLPSMKEICTMEVFEHRIDEEGKDLGGCRIPSSAAGFTWQCVEGAVTGGAGWGEG